MGHATKTRKYALRREAGWALKHSAGLQKHLAQVLNVDQSNVSRALRRIRGWR